MAYCHCRTVQRGLRVCQQNMGRCCLLLSLIAIFNHIFFSPFGGVLFFFCLCACPLKKQKKKQIDALEGRQRPLDKVLFSHSESALYASLFSDFFEYVTMRTFIDSSFFLFRVSTFDLWFSVFFFPGCFQFHRFRRSESVYSVLHKHAHINICIHRRPIEQCFFFFLSL